MPTRTANAEWNGTLRGGNGSFRGESGSINGKYSFGTRFENEPGSNPEELLAAAEAACFSMALSLGLEQNGTPAESVRTEAKCTIDQSDAGFTLTRRALDVHARVPNIDDAAFQRIVTATKDGCPVSRALKGNVDITVSARLD